MPRSTPLKIFASALLTAAVCAICATEALFGLPVVCSLVQFIIYAANAFLGCGVFLRGLGVFYKRRLNEEFFALAAEIFCVGYSAYETFMMIFTDRGADRLLFAPASAVITVSLIADRAGEKTRPAQSSAKLVEELKLPPARVLRDGAERVIPAEDIAEGDIVSISPEEKIPCDGVIIAGSSEIDEKPVTGALVPALKAEGGEVYAGSLNLGGYLTVRALGGESELLKTLSAYKKAPAKETGTRSRKFARAAGFGSLGLAAAALIILSIFGRVEAGVFAFAGIVAIFCPCGLSLSRYSAELRAAKISQAEGVAIKDPSSLSNLISPGAAVINKTGTATVGKLSVERVVPLSGLSEREIIRIAAALCANFPQADCFAIVEKCRSLDTAIPPCISPERLPAGLRGTVDGASAELSPKEENFARYKSDFPEIFCGKYAVRALIFGGEVAGLIALEDKIKPNAVAAAEEFSRRGIETVLLSGGALFSEAEELGAGGFEENATPERKALLVSELRSSGKSAIAVGDGLNDCAALRCADFSFALASGDEAAKESACAVLIRNDLRDIFYAIELAGSASRAEGVSSAAILAVRAVCAAISAALFALSAPCLGIAASAAGIALSCAAPALVSLMIGRENDE